MTVYENSDDYGFGGTWDSREYGSAGPRIACCVIRPYYIDWYAKDEASIDDSTSIKSHHRRLAEEHYGEEVDVFTPD